MYHASIGSCLFSAAMDVNGIIVNVIHHVINRPLWPLAPRLPRHSSTGAAGLHRDGRREDPETSRLLPSPPHHWEDRHHSQHGEDDERDQSVGDSSEAKEPHESDVSRREGHMFNDLLSLRGRSLAQMYRLSPHDDAIGLLWMFCYV